jgi:hypothetical protein
VHYAFVQTTQLDISCGLNKLFSMKIGQEQETKWSFQDVLGLHSGQNSTPGQTRNASLFVGIPVESW